MWKRFILILLGLLLVLYGGKYLILLAAGEETYAVVDKAEVKSLKTRPAQSGRPGEKKAAYSVRLEVDYHFDIYPPTRTRSEAMVAGLKNMPPCEARQAQKQMADLYQKLNRAYTEGNLETARLYSVEIRKLEDRIISYRKPVLQGVKGFDVITAASYSGQSPYRPGDRIRILYSRWHPSLNAVYSPKRLLVYGIFLTTAGFVAVLAGVISMRRTARYTRR